MKLTIMDMHAELGKHGFTVRGAKEFVNSMFSVIQDGLKADGIVKIKGFGTFKIIDIESRKSIDVGTGKKFEIPGHKKIVFVASKELKQSINAEFADLTVRMIEPKNQSWLEKFKMKFFK